MLFRDDYLKIIDEIRNIDKISLDEYITKRLLPLKEENEHFIETLYKDILYILQDIDKEGDNDLVIENGDITMEDGDFKLTGYQTRLHDVVNWLHSEMIMKRVLGIEKQMDNDKNLTLNVIQEYRQKMEKVVEVPFINPNYTLEYREKLDEIKRSIRKERKENYDFPKSKFKRIVLRIVDLDYWSVKPKFFGVEFDLVKFLRRIKR